jgi:tetratricopeptide (TPR) repeat protein
VTKGVTTSPLQGDAPGPLRRVDWPALAAGALLAAAAVAAYSRTFFVPFLFDDESSVTGNVTLRHLGTALFPPADATVGGRPILNISLAVNYAISGTSVWSYHAANLAIHVLAGLTLFGIVRRTLGLVRGADAVPVAFCTALLWTLHPLLTESVTYVVQRAESLMGLFYLLTLYCVLRGAESADPWKRLWYPLGIASCALGMATKEVMVSAPLVVFLYDRTFLSGGIREAWRRRGRLYCCLAATWAVLAVSAFSTGGRAATVGFGSGVSAGQYALTQLPAVVHYLRLCFWPHPLVFDYGPVLALPSSWTFLSALVVAGLAAATLWCLVKRPAAGFLGACFFAILAPSSSVVPVVTETVAEHRMYLALIPVVFLAVYVLHRWLGRAAWPVCLLLAAGLFWGTWERNATYRSAERIWGDTVARVPMNDRAQYNLGCALQALPGRLEDAVSCYERAVRIRPDNSSAYCNLGNALKSLGRMPDAVAAYEAALRAKPDIPEAENGIGNALLSLGRLPEAIGHYEKALLLRPDYAEAHNGLGLALARVRGREDEAVAQFGVALRLAPDSVAAHFNLANTLNAMGRTAESVPQFVEALRLAPGDAAIHFFYAGALLRLPGRTADAVAELDEVLRLQPDNEAARRVLARIQAAPK